MRVTWVAFAHTQETKAKEGDLRNAKDPSLKGNCLCRSFSPSTLNLNSDSSQSPLSLRKPRNWFLTTCSGLISSVSTVCFPITHQGLQDAFPFITANHAFRAGSCEGKEAFLSTDHCGRIETETYYTG